ncbi:MAG: VWA domain-containing protein [Rhodospirillales bacterium]
MIQFIENIKKTLYLLRDCRRGGVAVFLAFAIIPAIGFVGIGTDVARAYLVKSRLSSALDAAALAGGRSFFLPTRDADIDMFFNANFPAGYLGSTVTGPVKHPDEANETLELTASAIIPTSFMRVLGYHNVTVSAFSQVKRELIALDVVLAIDMSGSMTSGAIGGGSRISAARNAAGTLIDILFGTSSNKELLGIGLVPWNSKVNVTIDGEAYDPGLTSEDVVPTYVHPVTGSAQNSVFRVNNSPVPLLNDPGPDWTGCVFQRYLDDGDAANDGDILLDIGLIGSADWVAWEAIGPDGDPVPGSDECAMSIGGQECGPCLGNGITPLQHSKAVIEGKIDDLTSPQGQTNIPQGLGWAWRVLMPSAPFTEAIPDPPYRRQQAILLLTDGENVGGVGDGYKTTWGTGGAAFDEMNDRLITLAANIKADGVIVYVIQFANDDEDLKNVLKQVASGPDAPFYHLAPGAAELQTVFREVANHLTELRLSK